jgi:predicted Zn-dependent protease
MEKQAKWAADKPGVADWLLSYQSDTEAFFGRLAKARELTQHAVLYARQNGQKETAAGWQMNGALREAEFGNTARAHEQTMAVLASVPDAGAPAALALARAGDSARAQKIADEQQKDFPLATVLVSYWLPTVRAAIEINRNNPSKAIEFLEAATPLEMAGGNEMEWGCFLYPVYLRGQAYLQLHQGAEAATEFRKFIDHPNLVGNNPLFVLAHLGLARAYALQGERDKSRAAYQEFFNLWKAADPDIPIYKQAQAEYAKLQ